MLRTLENFLPAYSTIVWTLSNLQFISAVQLITRRPSLHVHKSSGFSFSDPLTRIQVQLSHCFPSKRNSANVLPFSQLEAVAESSVWFFIINVFFFRWKLARMCKGLWGSGGHTLMTQRYIPYYCGDGQNLWQDELAAAHTNVQDQSKPPERTC